MDAGFFEGSPSPVRALAENAAPQVRFESIINFAVLCVHVQLAWIGDRVTTGNKAEIHLGAVLDDIVFVCFPAQIARKARASRCAERDMKERSTKVGIDQ